VSPIGERDRLLVDVSAALAGGDASRLAHALAAAEAGGAGDGVEEALLQAYLFLGYPAALNAIALWRKLSGRAAPAATAEDWVGWRLRGEEVCRRVYGGAYGELRDNVRALHPDLETWMVTEGYGKVLGRPGLPLATRELCILALLAVQGVQKQLYSHLRGALQAGASEEEVEDALARALRHAPRDRCAAAMETWTRLRARREATDPPAVGG